MPKVISWEKYYSQLSNGELERRFLALLDTDMSGLEPFQAAKNALECVAIADELKRRGVPVTGPDGGPV